MQFFFVFALIVVAVFSTPLNVPNDFEIIKKFEDFEKKYSLKFATESERTYRLSVFGENLKEIDNLNKKYPGATFGITKFATWTKDEFHQKMLMPKDVVPSKISKPIQFDSSSIPKSPSYFDWRQKNVVTSIKNQKDCGSCWAFSSTTAIECQHAIKTAELVDLSEQQLIDCEWVSQGCTFGFVTPAFEYVKNNGQVLAKDYPYTDNRTKCQKLNTAKRIFIDGHVKIDSNDEAIASYVAAKGPVTFGLVCPDAMMHYKGGVLEIEDCLEQSTGLHAMVIVGYSSEFWIIKNSWGEDWGNKGYVLFKRGINMCDMNLDVEAPVIL